MSKSCVSCAKLKVEVKRLVRASKYILESIKPLKQSRDELLEDMEEYKRLTREGSIFKGREQIYAYEKLLLATQKAKEQKEKE